MEGGWGAAPFYPGTQPRETAASHSVKPGFVGISRSNSSDANSTQELSNQDAHCTLTTQIRDRPGGFVPAPGERCVTDPGAGTLSTRAGPSHPRMLAPGTANRRLRSDSCRMDIEPVRFIAGG